MAENNDGSASPRHGPGKPFEKGVSGNPGGRPKVVGRVRELARAHTEAAITVLVENMADADPRVRNIAAGMLLDRAWGKATTPIEVDLPVEEDAAPVSLLQLAREVAFALHLGMLEAAKNEAAAAEDA